MSTDTDPGPSPNPWGEMEVDMAQERRCGADPEYNQERAYPETPQQVRMVEELLAPMRRGDRHVGNVLTIDHGR
jgi:hypothetical protein